MQTRLPPQNIEAEQSVIGSLLIDNEAVFRAIEILTEEDFYKPAHQKIFRAIVNLAEKREPADLVTLTNQLQRDNSLEEVGGASYLASLIHMVPSAANVAHYAKIVREKAVLRRLIHVAGNIIEQSFGGEGVEFEEFLDQAESSLFEITDDRIKNAFTPIRDIVKSTFKVIETLYEKKQAITGIPTGFDDFDRLSSGLQASDLIIIAGRPSMGKTAFVLNVAVHAAIQAKHPVALFSLEMSKEQLALRMLTSLAKVDSARLRVGRLQDSDWPRLTRAAGLLAESPIYIDDSPAISVLEMRAKCRRLKAEGTLSLIIVDYLQLMKGRAHVESREKEISEISRGLKALAKELNVPIIALSQLNRGVEQRQDKRPLMADLRESGAIEQDADLIAFIYRDELYNKESEWKGSAEIIVSKQRNGPVGTVRLAFLSQYTTFENLARGQDAPSLPE